MNVGSLFSGIGGFDLGLERAGHRVVFQCESDPYRRRVLARHWPGVPCFEDVRSLRGRDLQRGGWTGGADTAERERDERAVDLVCGGFPCQDLSVAGKRAGLDGERSGLFFEFARIADDLLGGGGWLLIENVPGLLSSNGGRDFAVLLATLAELGFHDLAWRVLDSRYLGVPQRRRRVFILARRARGRSASEVLLEPKSGGGDFEASGEAREGPAGGSRNGPQFVSENQRAELRLTDHARQLTGGGGKPGQGYPAILSTPPDPDRVRAPAGVPGRVDDPFTFETRFARNDRGGPSDTVNALKREAGGTGRGDAAPMVVGAGEETDRCAHDPKPDGPRYAACGDAVTVQVAEWIGRRLP